VLQDNSQKVITINITSSSKCFNVAVTNNMEIDETLGTHHAVFWPVVKKNNTLYKATGFNVEANQVTKIPAEGRGNPTPARQGTSQGKRKVGA
tara:strand:+ start:482 stop:760 length:279 start_codon:yes stop_codon:yes gene_type:complete